MEQDNNISPENVQNQTPPVVSPPKSKNWTLVGTSALLVFFVGTTAFLAYQNYQLKRQPTQAKPTPMPIVQTPLTPTNCPATKYFDTNTAYPAYLFNDGLYKDSLYGFQIKIPKDWFINPTGGLKDKVIYPGDGLGAHNFNQNDECLYDESLRLLDTVKNPLTVRVVIETDKNMTLEEFKKQKTEEVSSPEFDNYDPEFQTEDVLIDGRPAIKLLYSNNKLTNESIAVINDKGYIFYFIFDAAEGLEKNRQIFNEILSSFKFID